MANGRHRWIWDTPRVGVQTCNRCGLTRQPYVEPEGAYRYLDRDGQWSAKCWKVPACSGIDERLEARRPKAGEDGR